MRYVEGSDLDRRLKAGSIDVADALTIVSQVASALDAAYAAGLVHRDVKPANILLEQPLDDSRAFLTDFGLTRHVGGSTTQLTRTGDLIATLDYAAPEQLQTGWVDARTDVYSLGCVLFRMLSGSVPFPGTGPQKMWKIVHEPIPPLAGPAAGLNGVIARATSKDPADRYLSAGDMARAVKQAVEPTSTTSVEKSVASGAAASGYSEADDEPPTRRLSERGSIASADSPTELPTRPNKPTELKPEAAAVDK